MSLFFILIEVSIVDSSPSSFIYAFITESLDLSESGEHGIHIAFNLRKAEALIAKAFINYVTLFIGKSVNIITGLVKCFEMPTSNVINLCGYLSEQFSYIENLTIIDPEYKVLEG